MEIQVLDRAAELPTANCLVLYDDQSATRWAEDVEACRRVGYRADPTTLVEAYRNVFGVDLVLSYAETRKRNEQRRRGGRDPNDVWIRVATTAATYLLEAILHRLYGADRLRPARVGVSWGGAVRDIITRVGPRPGRADGDGGALAVREYVQTHPGEQLARPEHWVLKNAVAATGPVPPGALRVAPTVGVLGSRDRNVESQVLARLLAELLGGEAVNHPEFAFLPGTHDPDEMPPEVAGTELEADWRSLDVVLCTCDEVRADLRGQVVGFPEDLYSSVRNAAGEFGTFYLQEAGGTVAPTDYGGYRSTGIPFSLMRAHASPESTGEVILVAGAVSGRVVPAWAALRSGAVSTFITDPLFAWNVLCREAPDLARS